MDKVALNREQSVNKPRHPSGARTDFRLFQFSSGSRLLPLSSTDLNPQSSTSSEQTSSVTLQAVRSVLLCGASVRSLAESAIAAGLRPLCVDFFQDEDLTKLLSGGRGRFVGRMNSFAELPTITHSVRSSIPMLWAGGLENHTDVLRKIAGRRPVIGADPDLIDQLRVPANLYRWWTDAGLCVPRLATHAADANCQWLQKPIAGSGGQGIAARSPRGALKTQDLLTEPSREYFQEYIDGVPMSATFCANQDGIHLVGMSLQLVGWQSLGASGFLFCGNVGPVEAGGSVVVQVQSAAHTIISHTALRGVFGIDFILRQGQAWFLEINPRLTASHLLYESTGSGSCTTLVERHLQAFGWQPPKLRSFRKRNKTSDDCPKIHARMVLWAPENMTVSDSFLASLTDGSDSHRLADIPKHGSVIPAGSPICSVHVSTSSLQQLPEYVQHLSRSNKPSAWFQWECVRQQLELLMERFQRNQ